jgi:hypothetical protein
MARDAGAAEVLLRQHVGRDLRPLLPALDAACWKTIVPSGLRISESPARNAILRMAILLLAYTDAPSASTIPRAHSPSLFRRGVLVAS